MAESIQIQHATPGSNGISTAFGTRYRSFGTTFAPAADFDVSRVDFYVRKLTFFSPGDVQAVVRKVLSNVGGLLTLGSVLTSKTQSANGWPGGGIGNEIWVTFNFAVTPKLSAGSTYVVYLESLASPYDNLKAVLTRYSELPDVMFADGEWVETTTGAGVFTTDPTWDFPFKLWGTLSAGGGGLPGAGVGEIEQDEVEVVLAMHLNAREACLNSMRTCDAEWAAGAAAIDQLQSSDRDAIQRIATELFDILEAIQATDTHFASELALRRRAAGVEISRTDGSRAANRAYAPITPTPRFTDRRG